MGPTSILRNATLFDESEYLHLDRVIYLESFRHRSIETSMLCDPCDNITLNLSSDDADVTIRRYSNLHELRASAEKCGFCALLHDEATTLQDPDVGEYCKQSWGTDFFNLVLRGSPILAAYRSHAGEHNVFISCLLDAQNTPGYPGGPTGLTWRSMLGGIYVETGQLMWQSQSVQIF